MGVLGEVLNLVEFDDWKHLSERVQIFLSLFVLFTMFRLKYSTVSAVQIFISYVGS